MPAALAEIDHEDVVDGAERRRGQVAVADQGVASAQPELPASLGVDFGRVVDLFPYAVDLLGQHRAARNGVAPHASVVARLEGEHRLLRAGSRERTPIDGVDRAQRGAIAGVHGKRAVGLLRRFDEGRVGTAAHFHTTGGRVPVGGDGADRSEKAKAFLVDASGCEERRQRRHLDRGCGHRRRCRLRRRPGHEGRRKRRRRCGRRRWGRRAPGDPWASGDHQPRRHAGRGARSRRRGWVRCAAHAITKPPRRRDRIRSATVGLWDHVRWLRGASAPSLQGSRAVSPHLRRGRGACER